ncbi:hypothetical protein DSO57_1031850 [Entomophthora muscae]|uniref:Uncharacterized protein n=1 Tax=Entomophthora muscae TaxID=34485 RepID=A0ACC2TYF4_9FUNG|nr:hypothetical protein DSO57_1031850 [Entomophthora muscae]
MVTGFAIQRPISPMIITVTMNNMVYIPLLDSTPDAKQGHSVANSTAAASEGEIASSRKGSLSVAHESDAACPTNDDSLSSNEKASSSGTGRHVSFDPATLGENYEPVDLSDPEGFPKKSNYLSENVYYSKPVPKALEPICEADKDSEQNADLYTQFNGKHAKSLRHNEDIKLPVNSRRRGLPKFNSGLQSGSDIFKETEANASEIHISEQAGEIVCHVDEEECEKLRCLADSQSHKRFEQESQEPVVIEASLEDPEAASSHAVALSENDDRGATPPPEAFSTEPEIDQAIQPCSGETQYATQDLSNNVPSRKLSGSDDHSSVEAEQGNVESSYMDSTGNTEAEPIKETYSDGIAPVQEQPYGNQQYTEEYYLPIAAKGSFENNADLLDDSGEMPYTNADAIPDSSDLSYAATPGGNRLQQIPESVAASGSHYEPDTEGRSSESKQAAADEFKEDESATGYYCPVARKFMYGVAPPEEVQDEVAVEKSHPEASLAPKELTQHNITSSRKQSDANDRTSSYYDPVKGRFVIISQEAPAEAAEPQVYSSGTAGHQTAYFDSVSGKFVIGTQQNDEIQVTGSSAPSAGGEYDATSGYTSNVGYDTGKAAIGYPREPVQYVAQAPQEAYAKAPGPYEVQAKPEATYEKPSSYFDANTGMFVTGYQRKPSQYVAPAPQEVYARASSPYEVQAKPEVTYEKPTSYFDANTGMFVTGYQRRPSQYLASAPQEVYVRDPNPYEVQAKPEETYEKPTSYFDANTGMFVTGYQRKPAQYVAPAPQEVYVRAPSPYEVQAKPEVTYEKPTSYFDTNTGTFVTGYQREPAQYITPNPQVYVSKPNTYEMQATQGSAYEKPYTNANAGRVYTGYQREPVQYVAQAPQVYASKPNAYEAHANQGAAYEKPSSYFDASTGTFVTGYQRETVQYATHAPQVYVSKSNTYETQATQGSAYEKPYTSANAGSVYTGYQHEPIQYVAQAPRFYASKPNAYETYANQGAVYEKTSSYFDANTGMFVTGYQRKPAPQAYTNKPNTEAYYEKPSYYNANAEEFDVSYQREPVVVPQVYVTQPDAHKAPANTGAPGYYDFAEGKFIHEPQDVPQEYNQEPAETSDYITNEQEVSPDAYEATTGSSQSAPIQESSTNGGSGDYQDKPKAYPGKSGAQEGTQPLKNGGSLEKHLDVKPSRPTVQRKPSAVGAQPSHNTGSGPKKSHPKDSSDSLNEGIHGLQNGASIGSKVQAKWRPIFQKATSGKLRFIAEQQTAPQTNCHQSKGNYAREAPLAFDAGIDHSYGERSDNVYSKAANNDYRTQTDGNVDSSEYMDETHEDPQEEDLLNRLGQDSSPQTPRKPYYTSYMKSDLLSGMPYFSKPALVAFAFVYMMASFKGSSGSFSILMILPLLCLLALCVAAMNISTFIKHNNIGWKCNDNFSISIFQDTKRTSTQAITLNTNHIISVFFLALALVGIISMFSISSFYVVGAFANKRCH